MGLYEESLKVEEKNKLMTLLQKFWEFKGFSGIFEGYYYSNSLDPKEKDTIVLYGQNGQFRVQYYAKENEIYENKNL